MLSPLQWKIGHVIVTRLLEIEQIISYNAATPFLPEATAEALFTMPELYPHFVTAEGALRLSYHALLVDAPGMRLVVDTCVGNDRARQFICDEPLQTRFLDEMCELGWSPESVDAVVCTHLHVDHVGWNTRRVDGHFVPTFPNARYCIARQEYDHFLGHESADVEAFYDDSLRPVLDAGLVDLVEWDHRFTPEISLLPTPGHTAGHVSVLIESLGESAIISGDVIHHPCQMQHPEWLTPWEHNRVMALATRTEFLNQMADSGARLIGTHFAAPTAGTVVRHGDNFQFLPEFSQGERH